MGSIEQITGLRQDAARLLSDGDGGWVVGGVGIGRLVANTLFAEEVQEGRWLIRQLDDRQCAAVRLGEVFGGGSSFIGCSMRGERLCQALSLKEAVTKLARRAAR